jgi:azurin
MTQHRAYSAEPLPLRRRLAAAVFGAPVILLGGWTLAASPPQRRIDLNISTDGDLLAFKPDRLTCVTGALVHLTFQHAGKYISQEHNWVLTVPGASAAVAQAGLAAGEKSGWVPRGDPRVLAATSPCSKGQHVSVDFVAPAPGDYPFLCTNPGHGAVMNGILHVTAS